MFKENVFIRMGIMFITVISRNPLEPKVFFNTNDQIKCVGYRCRKSLIDSKVPCAEVSSLATAPAPAAQK